MLKYEVDVIKQYKVENILFKKPTKIPPLSPFDIPEVDSSYGLWDMLMIVLIAFGIGSIIFAVSVFIISVFIL